MTVFVVHPINSRDVDIKDAERFGEIRYINDRYIYGDEITDDGQLPPMFRQAMETASHNFDPEGDFLLIAGDHLQLLAFSAWLIRWHCEYSVLRWSRDAKAYMPVRIHT